MTLKEFRKLTKGMKGNVKLSLHVIAFDQDTRMPFIKVNGKLTEAFFNEEQNVLSLLSSHVFETADAMRNAGQEVIV